MKPIVSASDLSLFKEIPARGPSCRTPQTPPKPRLHTPKPPPPSSWTLRGPVSGHSSHPGLCSFTAWEHVCEPLMARFTFHVSITVRPALQPHLSTSCGPGLEVGFIHVLPSQEPTSLFIHCCADGHWPSQVYLIINNPRSLYPTHISSCPGAAQMHL